MAGGWERTRPGLPDAALRRLLHLAPSSAVLVVERLALAGEVPVEWRHSVVRGDRYCFRAEWAPT